MSQTESFDNLLSLARCALDGTAAVLYWIGSDRSAEELHGLALPSELPRRYHDAFEQSDPLRSERLCRLGRRYAILSQECREAVSAREAQPYLSMLSEFGFCEALDILVWQNDVPLIGIGVFRDRHVVAAESDPLPLVTALQRHLENDLPSAPGLRDRVTRRMMQHVFGLTDREYDIASMIANGASNLDLCDAFAIRMPTVKTHVRNCFDKLGVDSRAGLVSLYLRPELWPSTAISGA